MGYAFQRSTTPPGKESSKSPTGETAWGNADLDGSSTKRGRGIGDTASFRFHSAKALRDSSSRSQKAATVSPLFPKRFMIFCHSE